MALQDKIRNLAWYNLVDKLEEILLETLENIENIWSRVKALESTVNNMPTYADNAAALAGGLSVGKLYKTATGEVRIVV